VASVCTHTIVLNFPPGDGHALRVRSVNSLGISEWSRTTFRVIDNENPDAPAQIAPVDGTSFTDIASVDLIWSKVPDSSSFDLRVNGGELIPVAPDIACVDESGVAANECRYTLDVPASDETTQEVIWEVRTTTPAGTSHCSLRMVIW